VSWALRQTDKALDDLADIHGYVSLDNPMAADKLVVDLLRLFERTSDYPMLGRAADDIAGNHRVLAHGRYLLIYCINEAERVVELVRVVHGARDWPMLFEN
jgi:toxin ParE1/3/4